MREEMRELTEAEFTRHLVKIAKAEQRLTRTGSPRWVSAILEKGGVVACEDLMATYPDHMSDGFARLWEEDRVDLTVEWQVFYCGQKLFDPATLRWAKDGIEIFRERGSLV